MMICCFLFFLCFYFISFFFFFFFFFFSSRRRHTRFSRDWSSDVCSSDLFRLRGACCGRIYPALHAPRKAIGTVYFCQTALYFAWNPTILGKRVERDRKSVV